MSEQGFLRSEKGFIAIPEEKDVKGSDKKPVLDRRMADFALWTCVAMLLLALPAGWPYGYYTLLRWVVCLTTGYLAHEGYKQGRRKSPVLLGAIALLFNPIVPVHMSKSDWASADLIVAVVLIFYALRGKAVHLGVEKKKRRTLVIGIGLCVAALGLYAAWSQYRYSTYDYPISLVSSQANFHPQQFLRNIKGELTVHGWQVKRIAGKPHTYLVSYTYSRSTPLDLSRLPDQPTHPPDRNLFDDIIPSTWGWWWEVNTRVPLVRTVSGDSELEKKYGFVQATEPVRSIPPISLERLKELGGPYKEAAQRLEENQRIELEAQRVGIPQPNLNLLSSESTTPPIAPSATIDKVLRLPGRLSTIQPNGLIEILDRYGFTTPIIVTQGTVITIQGRRAAFENLRSGVEVEVDYGSDAATRKRYALEIRVQ